MAVGSLDSKGLVEVEPRGSWLSAVGESKGFVVSSKGFVDAGCEDTEASVLEEEELEEEEEEEDEEKEEEEEEEAAIVDTVGEAAEEGPKGLSDGDDGEKVIIKEPEEAEEADEAEEDEEEAAGARAAM